MYVHKDSQLQIGKTRKTAALGARRTPSDGYTVCARRSDAPGEPRRKQKTDENTSDRPCDACPLCATTSGPHLDPSETSGVGRMSACRQNLAVLEAGALDAPPLCTIKDAAMLLYPD